MRVKIVSDLHLDFHADGGVGLLKEIGRTRFNVLVIAGDLTSYCDLDRALELVCTTFDDKQIIYVFGNHEMYGGTRTEAFEKARKAEKRFPHLHVLENQAVVLPGWEPLRFIGCTLWFPHSGKPELLDKHLNDFSEIKGIYEWLPTVAEESALYLEKNIQENDFVVTHHLPHPRSIAERFRGSPLNKYFVHDISKTMESGYAAYWAHGHTHESANYKVAEGWTHVYCNPFGYARRDVNSDFKADLAVEYNF